MAARQPDPDAVPVIEEAPVRVAPTRARLFARGIAATLVLTADELVVVSPPEDGSRVLMRQARANLAMARRPRGRGGEQVELNALDGQQATLRFDREHAPAAETIVRWLAGL